MRGGYLLRCDLRGRPRRIRRCRAAGHPAASGIGKGDEIEVQAAKLEVQYVIAFPGGEPEIWMLAMPKRAEQHRPCRSDLFTSQSP